MHVSREIFDQKYIEVVTGFVVITAQKQIPLYEFGCSYSQIAD